MGQIFLSYSSEDKSQIETFADNLRLNGYDVWWDQEIPIGKSYAEVLENKIRSADCVIVVWTARSVQSQWVKNEATIAERLGKIVPVMMEEIELPLAFMHLETALLFKDFESNQQIEHELLYSAINRCIGKPDHKTTFPPPPIPIYLRLKKMLPYMLTVLGLTVAGLLYWKYRTGPPESKVYTIRGVVRNPSSQPLAGVELNIEGTPYFGTSASDGKFEFEFNDLNQLPDVLVTSSLPGYRDTALRISLQSSKAPPLDFILQPDSNP
jgi:hypothetical protein